MLIPYRVKNPIESFPYATLSLILLNVVVYGLTTQSFLMIRPEIIKQYAFAFGTSPFTNFFASIFLHGEILHLAGNMLFLWVFGPPVEDRLGKFSYLIVYFIAGFAGSMTQGIIDKAVTGHVQVGIGASGCIMGVVGAYWYAFSWSKVCVFYWIWFIRGAFDIAAVWIVGLYFLLDVMNGVLYGVAGVTGGVANFAHIGGALIGVLMCVVMRVKRDTEAISEAKAIQSDMKDISMLPLHAIQTMLEEDPGNPELIRAMIVPALGLHQESAIHAAMQQAGPGLAEKVPELVAHYLADLRGQCSIYQAVHLLRLAGQMERGGDPQKAVYLYKLVINAYPPGPDVESAFYRLAQCYWGNYRDGASAKACLAEMEKRFPGGPMTQFGRTMWRQLDA